MRSSCCVKDCKGKGVVRLGGGKTYCANCYTFILSNLMRRGQTA